MANGNGAKTNKRIIKGGAAVLEAERERVEKALAETEQSRTTPILNSLSEHVVFQDLEQRVLWANKAAGDSVGLSSEELVGRYCYDVWGRGGEPCPGCPVTKARKTRKPQAGEMTTPDGKVWLVRGYPVRDASGDITGLVEMTLEITERKKSEEQLQAERNKLQSVIGAMEDGLNIMDKDYNIIYQSRLPRKLYGDRLGEKCYRVYAGEEEVCVGCPVKKAFNDGKSHSSEKKLLTPSGKVSYWETIANPVRDASGHIVSCLEIARNITERKQAEDELKAERNKLKSVVNAMADGLTIHDKEFNIIYQNEQVRNDYGDRVGEKCYRVYENIDTVCDGCPVKKAFKDGKSHTADRQVVLPSGKVAFSEVKASPIRDAEGRIVSCLEIIRDTNERKQAEEALRESEEKFRLLAENSLMGIFIIQDSKIVYLNPSFAKAFGYKPEEIVNSMHPSEFIHPDDKNFMMQRLADRYAAKVTDRDISFKAVRRDGSTFFVEATAVLTEYRGKPAVMGTFIDITERKQAEDELKAEKNKLQSVVDAIEYGITIQDRDYNIIYQNEQAKKPFGERIGEKCYRAYSGNEQVCDGCPVEKAFKDGKSHTVVRPNISPSGKVTYWENTANPVRDAQGNIVSCLEVTRDITKRKQAEEALKASEEFRSSLLKNSPIPMLVINPDTSIKYVNPALEELTGFSAAEVIGGKAPYPWWTEETLEKISGDLAEAMVKGAVRLEELFKKKNGEQFWVEITSTPVRKDGEFKYYLANWVDITERKQAEESLRESELKYKTLVEATSDITWEVDDEGWFTFVSPKIKDVLGYEVNEVVGRKRTLDLVAEGEAPKWLGRFKKINAKRAPFFGFEVTHLHKNGTPVVFEMSGIPLFDSAGDFKGYVGTNKDVTGRKQMQEQLAIADRLASVGELAAGIAHELNNPLTGVIGFSQLMLEKEMPGDIKEDMEAVYGEAQRASQVVGNLLTFARKHAVVKQMLNINSVIAKVLELRAYEQRVENISVEARFDPTLPEIMADYFQLQQVFLNIIINAEYFMKKAHQKGKLTITTEKVNSKVRASFADDGPGIDKEILGHLFDPFFTTKEVGEGTGLGLSICHGIVAEHGGRIYVESKLGKGTTFIVELPIGSARRKGGTA